MRILLILFLACAVTGPSAARGQSPAAKSKTEKTPVISGAIVDSSNRSSIYVTFDYPLPAIKDLPGAGAWTIYEKTQEGKDAPPHIGKLEVDAIDTSDFAHSSTVLIKLKNPVSKSAKALDMTIVTATYILHLPAATLPGPPEGSETQHLAGSTGKSDSDVYFNGSFAATEGSNPIYDVDAFAGYMEGIQHGNAYYGQLGVYGQVRTKQSQTGEPNSFQVYGVYQRLLSTSSHWHGQFQIPYFNYRFAGAEFDLSGNQLNFVTSPMVTIPVRLSKKTLGPIEPGFSVPRMVFSLGTEFVDVEMSALAATGAWHARGLLGASFSSGYKPPEPKPLFQGLQLTSSYQVRLPSAPEIFYDPKFAKLNTATGKLVTPPMLGTQPRHFVDTTICYNFVKWVAFTFENTYGSLPPAFNKVDPTFTLGLSFTLKQTSYGRYSILRP
jgi:hypothetical protein